MSQVQQQEEQREDTEQPVEQVQRARGKWDVKGFINSPYLLLVLPLLVGGFFLVLNPQYVVLAMNYPFAAVFILAIPVCLFVVKLVINFFSVIEQWIKLQFERARNAKKGHFFELVTAVFMFVSVCEAGPFFNDIQHNMLGGALGYITVLAFDLIAVMCIDSRRKELAKGGTKAGRSLLGVFICAGVSMIANLYSALLNFQAPTVQNFPEFLKAVAPYVGIMFPIMIVFLAFSRDAEVEVDDAETFKQQQNKRVAFLVARRETLEQITHEMIHIDLIKQREFFLKGWLFTKKKVNMVIEVVTQRVLEVIKADLTTLKKTFVEDASKEVKASYKLQFEKLEAQVAEVKVQNQQVLETLQGIQRVQKSQSESLAELQLKVQEPGQLIGSAVQVEVTKRLEVLKSEFNRLHVEDLQKLQNQLRQSQVQQLEGLEIELKKLKVEHAHLQNHAFQSPVGQPAMSDQQKIEQKGIPSNKQPIELEAKRSGRFNKTQFVLDCLKENSDMPSSEIKDRAEKLQQSVSDQIISMARSDFKSQQQLKEVETGEFEKIEVGS
jgi:hypothetical protein